jgi:hypothetical protein
MRDNLIALAVGLVLYPIAYAYQMLPDGEQTEGIVENPDELGYHKGEMPSPVGFEVADTFPEEWCYAGT